MVMSLKEKKFFLFLQIKMNETLIIILETLIYDKIKIIYDKLFLEGEK